MKAKRILVVSLAVLASMTTALIAWSNSRSKSGPLVFSAIDGSFKRERVMFSVNPRGALQTIWWSSADSQFEDLEASLKAKYPKAEGWTFHSGTGKGLKIASASKGSGFESIEIRERRGGTISVVVQGEATKADFWAEWIRTRGQVRVYDPMHIGLFRKAGPLPTAARP